MPTPPATTAFPSTEAMPVFGLRLLATFDGAVFRLIAFLALAPMLLRAFGEVQFGAVLVATALFGWLAWPVRSVQALCARWIAAARLVGDTARVQRLAAAGLAVQAVYALPGLAAMAAAAPWLAGALGVSGTAAAAVAWYWSLAAARHGLATLAGTYAALASASDGGAEAPSVRAVAGLQTLFEVAAALFVVAHELPLPWLAGLELGAAMIGTWLLRELVRIQSGGGALLGRPDAAILRALAAAPASSPSAPQAPLPAFDVAVIAAAAVAGMAPAAVFAVAARAARLLADTATAIGRQLTSPLETHALALGSAAAREAVRRATDAALVVAVGLGVLLAAFTRPVLQLALGVEPGAVLRGDPGPALGLLVATAPIAWTSGAWLLRSGHGTTAMLCLGTEAAAVALGSLVMVGSAGIAGVAWAAVAAHALTSAWFLPLAVGAHLRMRALAFVWGRAWRALLVAAPVAVAGLVLAGVRPARSGRELAIQLCIVAILHAVAAFAGWFLLQPHEGLDQD